MVLLLLKVQAPRRPHPTLERHYCKVMYITHSTVGVIYIHDPIPEVIPRSHLGRDHLSTPHKK